VECGQLGREGQVFLSIQPFIEFSSDFRTSVEKEAEAYAHFLGASDLDITWSRS